jgi:predicted O-methyltransferase YrrM
VWGNLKRVIDRLRLSTGLARRWFFLEANVLEVRNLAMLRKAMGWTREPDLDFEHLHEFEFLEDLNDRRLRDAEVIGSACANGEPKVLLEIGTSRGHTTALMARNAPQATVHTVNIPPEEVSAGGTFVTSAPGREEIGSFYRELGLGNVRQILANTARWSPDFGPIDVAFIDGCHDADFVFHDTAMALDRCRPGSLILWHDFSPRHAPVYQWIAAVCDGVERLYRKRRLRGPILHLEDSWVGLYRVP